MKRGISSVLDNDDDGGSMSSKNREEPDQKKIRIRNYSVHQQDTSVIDEDEGEKGWKDLFGIHSGHSFRNHEVGEKGCAAKAPCIAIEPVVTSHPLRLLIVGHNPSDMAWEQGHYYANPSNWMWKILLETGLAPSEHVKGCHDDFKMPCVAGVGLCDVVCERGTDSQKFSGEYIKKSWRQSFYDRIYFCARTVAQQHGCNCEKHSCGGPSIVAFSGKRQFIELFDSRHAKKRESDSSIVTRKLPNESADQQYSATGGHGVKVITKSCFCPAQVDYGRQAVVPVGWPLDTQTTEVWVLPSTSGAAAMSKSARIGPWMLLADRVKSIPHPRLLSCPNFDATR